MKIGVLSRWLATVASAFLIVGGINEWSSQSSGAKSWADETSITALGLRAQGKLKVGIGLGFLALAATGVDLAADAAARKGMDN